MELNKITLPEAYMIETIRSKGVSDQELLAAVESGDIGPWREFNANFDFTNLVTLAEKDPSKFKSIILDGYGVKFLTIYGLKNLLKFKLGLVEERDYQLTERGITDLKVEDGQLMIIKQFLSNNWTLEELASNDESGKVIKIEL